MRRGSGIARVLWARIEPLHAVTYFARESREGAKRAGLKGFWMGYFGFRAAPLGRAMPGLIEATFANFSPSMIARSIPDAWKFASPEELVAQRARAAAAGLRRIVPQIDDASRATSELLERIAPCVSPLGRPLFAANASVERFDDPIEWLWQLCTTLREHRGDGHVALLAAADIDGCEAHVLHAAEFDTSSAIYRDNRGWTIDDWDAATARLSSRGLLLDGSLTASGLALRHEIEDETDRLAAAPIRESLSETELERLVDLLGPPAHQVRSSGTIPFPNPIGQRESAEQSPRR